MFERRASKQFQVCNHLHPLTKLHSSHPRAHHECPPLNHFDIRGCLDVFEQRAVVKCMAPNLLQPIAKLDSCQLLAITECTLFNGFDGVECRDTL